MLLLRRDIRAGKFHQHKFNPDQPRVPAGGTGGGQWTSGSGGGGSGLGFGAGFGESMGEGLLVDPTGEACWSSFSEGWNEDGSVFERDIVNRDGSTIRSEYAASGEAGFDERQTVRLESGETVSFETIERVQTIRYGGADGEVVSRSLWTPSGPKLGAAVQPVLLGPLRTGVDWKAPPLEASGRRSSECGEVRLHWHQTHHRHRSEAEAMTTRRQVRLLLAPLLARNPDLVDFGTYAILKPVRHIIRGIWVDQTSSADRPDFLWSLAYAFDPMTLRRTYWLEGFFPPKPVKSLWSDPAMPEAIRGVAEAQILPMLRAVGSIEEFIALKDVMHGPYALGFEETVIKTHMDLAFGHFDAALKTCQEIKDLGRRDFHGRMKGYHFLLDEMLPLLEAHDHAGVVSLLHRREESTIRRLGLKSIWEPSPFPVELQPP